MFRLIQANYETACRSCGSPIKEGEDVGWDPEDREIVCFDCAEGEFDEEM